MRILLLFCLCVVSIHCIAQQEKTYSSKSSRKAFYADLGKKYSTLGIIEVFKNDTEDAFDDYTDGTTESALVDNYSTVIHELLHGYNETDENGHTYFVEPGVAVYVPFTKFFKSRELNAWVRPGLQDSIFRYGLYVGGKSETVEHKGETIKLNGKGKNEVFSIQQGIYGLLEEFDAYYHGTESAFGLYNYYKSKYGEDNENKWLDYKHEVLGEGTAFYEFNLFIGWYLVYARQKQPEVYKEIYANKALRVTYTLLHDKFKSLMEKAEPLIKEISSRFELNIIDLIQFNGSDDDIYVMLQSAGLKPEQMYTEEIKTVNGKQVKIKKRLLDDDFWKESQALYKEFEKQVLKDMTAIRLFHGQHTRQIEFLKGLFTKDVAEELNKFRIEGVTAANYRSYLN